MTASIQTHDPMPISTLWPARILKRDFLIDLGKMLQPQQSTDKETEEFYLRSANVHWDGVDLSDVKTMWFTPAEKRDLLLRAGDLVVNEGGDVGRCAVWQGTAAPHYFQNAINRVRARTSASTRFLYYWLYNLKHAGFIDAMVSRITIAHLTAEKLARVPWPDVPAAEQHRIAAYLGASCAAIDAAVSAKRRQLDTLDALRKSIIQRAVTQGLNPKVALKPSGLDWVVEVPTHWKVQQIKRNCSLVRGQFTHRPRNDPALYDGPYPFIQTGDITAAGKYIRTYSQTLNELGLSASKQFPRGTLVMSIAANIGDVAILDFEACFPDSMIGMIPDHKAHLDFLYYLMRAMRPIMLRSAVQSTQLNLNYVRIGTNFAPFPPLEEQRAIAEYLDAKEIESHRISETIQAQIDTITAYRKSLIHECVTGQRRVTDANALDAV
ncbi:MAG: restriction endonuclease subunit S [Rhodoferax sp.]|nr:restriction endonuclease subunit S [Rhodoferax sp.]